MISSAVIQAVGTSPEWTVAGKILFALLIGHALADYPLQGAFLARAKDRAIKAIWRR